MCAASEPVRSFFPSPGMVMAIPVLPQKLCKCSNIIEWAEWSLRTVMQAVAGALRSSNSTSLNSTQKGKYLTQAVQQQLGRIETYL
jgi:hypothetical protein